MIKDLRWVERETHIQGSGVPRNMVLQMLIVSYGEYEEWADVPTVEEK